MKNKKPQVTPENHQDAAAIKDHETGAPLPLIPESENLMPAESWDLEQLAAYVKDRFHLAEFFGRKSAVQIWRAGKALLLVKEKLKAERKWTSWAKQHDLPLTSVYEAMKLAEKFENERDIIGFSGVDAKMVAGTFKPRAKEPTGGTPLAEG